MTTTEMITELTKTVSNLQRDVESLKEDKDYLYRKLEKAYDDRIQLRAENQKLKSSVNHNNEEEECIACSA
jgi:FtsZ-binding cell division protein ZapB